MNLYHVAGGLVIMLTLWAIFTVAKMTDDESSFGQAAGSAAVMTLFVALLTGGFITGINLLIR